MTAPRKKRAEGEGTKLYTLLRAIAIGDSSGAALLLDASPGLASEPAPTGAAREAASRYFLEEIEHYIYAGDTALHIAAAGYQTAIAKELVARGAAPRARNRRGAEPLHYASDGHPGSKHWNPNAQAAIVEYLISEGGDPNATDKSGVTPLHRAVRTRCAAAVRVLLEHGADSRRKNANGSTPLHLAVQNTGRGGSGVTDAREQQREIVHLLMKHGARPTDGDDRGKSVTDSVSSDWVKDLLRV